MFYDYVGYSFYSYLSMTLVNIELECNIECLRVLFEYLTDCRRKDGVTSKFFGLY